MSFVLAVTIAVTVAALAALLWLGYTLADIGSDTHAFGPWNRPEAPKRHTRLPADFIALWSLFGEKSIQTYAGSWEAAVRRLSRLEVFLDDRRHIDAIDRLHPESSTVADTLDPTAPDTYSPEWVVDRIVHLEMLAGLLEPGETHEPPTGQQ